MIFVYLLTALTLGFFWGRYVYMENSASVSYPELDRVADLLLISNNLKDIKEFARSKVSYLSKTTFEKLCSKIEELNADAAINEDDNSLKVRIADLESKEMDLKKLQAEGFMETINALKKMCR